MTLNFNVKELHVHVTLQPDISEEDREILANLLRRTQSQARKLKALDAKTPPKGAQPKTTA